MMEYMPSFLKRTLTQINHLSSAPRARLGETRDMRSQGPRYIGPRGVPSEVLVPSFFNVSPMTDESNQKVTGYPL